MNHLELISTQALYKAAKEIYARTPEALTWHQKLVSVWRPFYAPFDALLKWIPEHSSLLDIGCGTGCFLFLALKSRRVRHAIGVDVSASSLALARKVNPFSEQQVEFHIGKAIEPGWLTSVQVVSVIDALHHIPALERTSFLAQLASDCQAGTRLIIKDLDPKPRWKAWANTATDYLSTRSRVSYCGLSEVAHFFEQRGWKTLESSRLDKHVWNHYAWVGEKC